MAKLNLTDICIPYRGPTDVNDHINFFSEVLYNLILLGQTIDTGSTAGQSDYILNNFTALWEGTDAPILRTLPLVATLCKAGETPETFRLEPITSYNTGGISDELRSVQTIINNIRNDL